MFIYAIVPMLINRMSTGYCKFFLGIRHVNGNFCTFVFINKQI